MSASTSGTPAWRLVAEREMTTRLRDKTFLGGVAFMLVPVIAGMFVSAWLSGRAETYEVAVVDETGATVAGAAEEVLRAQDDETSVEVTEESDDAAAEQAVADEQVDVALLPADNGYTVLGQSEIDEELQAACRRRCRRPCFRPTPTGPAWRCRSCWPAPSCRSGCSRARPRTPTWSPPPASSPRSSSTSPP